MLSALPQNIGSFETFWHSEKFFKITNYEGTGDLNGRVRANNSGLVKYMDREGETVRNGNNKRNIKLCRINQLVSPNTKLKQEYTQENVREKGKKFCFNYRLLPYI